MKIPIRMRKANKGVVSDPGMRGWLLAKISHVCLPKHAHNQTLKASVSCAPVQTTGEAILTY